MRELRVLLYETPHDPYMNLAFEEAFTRVRAADLTCDTLRIWRNDRAVVIGYFQEAGAEVKLAEAEKLGIRVVRRFTGGGAVYHDLGNINFALAIKAEGVKDPISYLYSYLIGGALRALKLLGASPRLENVNDIVVNQRKVSGVAASTRWGVYFLHGCILVNADLTALAKVLRVPKEKLRDKGVSEVKYRVANLSEVLGRELSYRELVKALVKGYEEHLKAESYVDLPSKEEVRVAQLLYEYKYSRNEWNLYRAPHSAFKNLEEKLKEILA
ncbi:MAG: lipoate--protein ligase family protein [Thermoprotei archaeon]|nr:MAG: lipoate--protein ligase family protein [Thermoprotei archaeon]